MADAQIAENVRNFTLSTEVFEMPNLDIYSQMVCVLLHSYSNESVPTTLSEIARQGRMSLKQATKALQSLVDLKILQHKLFREIIGDYFDDRLSWAAKGLLVFLKNNSQTTLDELLELSSESQGDEQSLRRGLDELRRYGYLADFPGVSKVASTQDFRG